MRITLRSKISIVINQEKIRTLGEKENYKYLGILEMDIVKQVVMKEKVRQEYFSRTRKLFESKLCSSNLTNRINIWDVSLEIYLTRFLQWMREELHQMNKKTNDDAQGLISER